MRASFNYKIIGLQVIEQSKNKRLLIEDEKKMIQWKQSLVKLSPGVSLSNNIRNPTDNERFSIYTMTHEKILVKIKKKYSILYTEEVLSNENNLCKTVEGLLLISIWYALTTAKPRWLCGFNGFRWAGQCGLFGHTHLVCLHGVEADHRRPAALVVAVHAPLQVHLEGINHPNLKQTGNRSSSSSSSPDMRFMHFIWDQHQQVTLQQCIDFLIHRLLFSSAKLMN